MFGDGAVPMIRNRAERTVKPMSWIGFRPQESIKRNAAR